MTPQFPKKPVSSFATRRGLPTLTGTAAQIKWAEEIRKRLVEGLDRHICAGHGERSRRFAQTKEWMLAHVEAAWWIENRGYKPTTVQRGQYSELLDVYGSIMGPAKRRTA